MLIAITGPSGFIGSHIARTLYQAGHKLRGLVRPTSRRDHIASYVSEFTVGHHADPQAIAGLVAGADAVIHNSADFAAIRTSPLTSFNSNVLASLQLLESARQANVGQFLFISSAAVYHDILQDRPLDENHPTTPSSIYGAYKAAIEPHLLAYHKTFGMNTSSWRPAAVYGENPTLEKSQWYDEVKMAREGGTVSTDHGGKITHVQDIADAMRYALDDQAVAGQFYNLIDGYMYWQQAAEIAKEMTKSNATIVDKKGKGPKNQFDTKKAVAFFDGHGNKEALRRGEKGVREYVGELLKRMAGA